MSDVNNQLLLIVNPESGNKQAVIDIAAEVLPLLNQTPYQLRTTEYPGHAGIIAQEFMDSGAGNTILAAGGDGTIHEIVNTLVLGPPDKDSANHDVRNITLILWPAGTANALYASLYPSTAPNPAHQYILPPDADEQTAYKLKSLIAYLHHRSLSSSGGPDPPARPLSLAYTEIHDAGGIVTDKLIAVVVTSTSLHAAILHTAEELRSSIPGLARFKEAAMRNVTNWSASDVTLFGTKASGIQLYDISQDALVQVDNSASVALEGPFSYFLTTVNVDRLEPTFCITAPFTTHPPPSGTPSMEVVVLRPARDPELAQGGTLDSEASRLKFAQDVIGKVFPAAYDKGGHVKLRYGEGEEAPIIEYYRATGWEWRPLGSDEASRLVCIDGTIKVIPEGGKAVCRILEEGVTTPGVRSLKLKVLI